MEPGGPQEGVNSISKGHDWEGPTPGTVSLTSLISDRSTSFKHSQVLWSQNLIDWLLNLYVLAVPYVKYAVQTSGPLLPFSPHRVTIAPPPPFIHLSFYLPVLCPSTSSLTVFFSTLLMRRPMRWPTLRTRWPVRWPALNNFFCVGSCCWGCIARRRPAPLHLHNPDKRQHI